MDKIALVDPPLEETEKLLNYFDQNNIIVDGAVWGFDHERERWKLWLAGKTFDERIIQEQSMRPALLELINHMSKAGLKKLTFEDTRLEASDDKLFQDIARDFSVKTSNSHEDWSDSVGFYGRYYLDKVIVARLTNNIKALSTHHG
jgi:hypothetical protein